MPRLYNHANGQTPITSATPINSQPLPGAVRRGRRIALGISRCTECDKSITLDNPTWRGGCWDCRSTEVWS